MVRNSRLSESDVEEALREHGRPRPEIQCAFPEGDGEVTILRNPRSLRNQGPLCLFFNASARGTFIARTVWTVQN
ncbi:hypothetical protein [Massilia sp. BSC265]|uniref:hypothetical protein n=1 Tax=Massilia sp. BSC265 TaxID=1549812 RepID=UPI000AB3318B|nr:hypothetical protein [Massilia sp. BSC265]